MTIQTGNNFSTNNISRLDSGFKGEDLFSGKGGTGSEAGGGSKLEQLAKLAVGILLATNALQEMGQGKGAGEGEGEGVKGVGEGKGAGEGGGVGEGEGKGVGEGNSLKDFLSELLDPEGKEGEGKKAPGSDEESKGMNMEELLKGLLEYLLGGKQGQGAGSADGKSDGGSVDGAKGAGGKKDSSPMGDLADKLGLGDNQKGLSELGDKLLQGLSEALMKGLMSPTKDGGGQLSGDSKDIIDMLSKFMDSNKTEFGSP